MVGWKHSVHLDPPPPHDWVDNRASVHHIYFTQNMRMGSMITLEKVYVKGKKERKKDNSNVATSMNCGIAFFSSWSKSMCNPETGITRIRGPLTTTTSFGGEHLEHARISKLTTISPKGKPLGSHMVG